MTECLKSAVKALKVSKKRLGKFYASIRMFFPLNGFHKQGPQREIIIIIESLMLNRLNSHKFLSQFSKF